MKGPLRFPLPMINVWPTLWGNALLMLLTGVGSRMANVLLFAFIARHLGAEPAGAFKLALTYTAIFLSLSQWGLDELLVRDVAQDRRQAGLFTLHFGVARLVFSAGAYVVLLALLYLVLPYAPSTRLLISLVGLTLVADGLSFLGQALFNAFEDLRFPALVAAVTGMGKALGGVLALFVTAGQTPFVRVVVVGSVFALSSWIGVGAYGLGVLYLLGKSSACARSLPLRWDRRFLSHKVGQASTFGLINVFYVIEFQFDAVLLSLFLGEQAVGWYGVAQTVFTVFLLVPQAYRTALYPVMSRLYAEEGGGGHRLQKLYGVSFQFLFFLGLPLAVGVTLLAPEITALFFGQPVAPAAGALRWIAWALLIQFLNVPDARLMLASGRQRQAARFLAISMGVSLLANLSLIPLLGVPGVGLVRFLSSVVFFVLNHMTVYRHICPYTPWRGVLSASAAAGLMGGLVWLARGQALWVQGLIGCGVYGLSMLLLGFGPHRWLVPGYERSGET